MHLQKQGWGQVGGQRKIASQDVQRLGSCNLVFANAQLQELFVHLMQVESTILVTEYSIVNYMIAINHYNNMNIQLFKK